MKQFILFEKQEEIAVITLNRSERHNSLVIPLLEELLMVIQTIRADADLRAVILQANGRSFSTGGDVRGFYEHLNTIESYAHTLVGLLNQTILALMDLPIPVIAAVHGLVTGGSLGLVLGADVVLIAPEASFVPYYSVVGFSPDGGWTALLPSIIGPKRVAELLMRNGTITAEQAVAWGFAGRIVSAGHIRDEALKVARNIVAQKGGSLRNTKYLLNVAFDNPADRLEAERAHFVQQVITEEARQGLTVFVEKRPVPSQ